MQIFSSQVPTIRIPYSPFGEKKKHADVESMNKYNHNCHNNDNNNILSLQGGGGHGYSHFDSIRCVLFTLEILG